MNPFDRLSDYLRKVERRLRVLAWTRGAALTAAAALLLTVMLVWIANSFAFSSTSMAASRTVLVLALGGALAFGLAVPLLRLNRRKAATKAEQKFPQFEERLVTFAERAADKPDDPFLHLLADDALKAAQTAQPEEVAAKRSLVGLGSLAATAAGILIWLGTSGPGFWGYGTSLLWAGPPKAADTPFYDLIVEPGNKTVRKRADQMITARTVGFTPARMRLLARYASASKWEETQMRPVAGSPEHQFLLSGLPESLDYYVEAGNLKSKTFKLTVIDLPSVKRIRVRYDYPAWTGMKPVTEDPGGDLRAVVGTVAGISVETDKPLANGVLVLDDGTRLPLIAGRASLTLKKDGVYHIAAVEQGETVRLSDDYFIEARQDSKPTVKIVRPGRDAKVNPVEEVPIVIEAQDDFGLHDLKLHYSVNGGKEQAVTLLASKGAQTAEGRTLIALEEHKMAPGDIVAFYASARDAQSTARTDMFFVEAQPFER
ncbi:MAG: hypothetical protein ACRD96_25565, partial [Bryobacteraceae bacterium]